MLMRGLLLLFLGLFVELTLLLRLADALGWTRVLAWILFTGFLGVWLFRRGGMQSFARMNAALQSGNERAVSVVESALLVFSGLLLMVPGVVADTVGLALLFPPLRRYVAERMLRRFRGQFLVFRTPRDSTFVDVEVVDRASPARTAPRDLLLRDK